MNTLVWAALLSMTPIIEMQGGIPVAIAGGYPIWVALLVCLVANLLIVPILYFFLEVIHKKLLHVNHTYQSLFDKVMERTRSKTHKLVEKYGVYGVIVLVALPGPGTGAYTATLASWFFGMDKWKAFIAISIGMFIASLIILAATLGIMNGWKFFV